jgi:hypothetical protein
LRGKDKERDGKERGNTQRIGNKLRNRLRQKKKMKTMDES